MRLRTAAVLHFPNAPVVGICFGASERVGLTSWDWENTASQLQHIVY